MRNQPTQTDLTDSEIDAMCIELWGDGTETLLLLNPMTPERRAEREAREAVRSLFEFTETDEFANCTGAAWG